MNKKTQLVRSACQATETTAFDVQTTLRNLAQTKVSYFKMLTKEILKTVKLKSMFIYIPMQTLQYLHLYFILFHPLL